MKGGFKLNEKLNSIKEKVNKFAFGAGAGVVTALAVAAPTFAADVADFTITSAMLDPVTNAVNSGVTTILPIGLKFMGIMVGIGLIPRLIYRFI